MSDKKEFVIGDLVRSIVSDVYPKKVEFFIGKLGENLDGKYAISKDGRLGFYYKDLELVRHATEEDRYIDIMDKINKLWNKQSWVKDGMPPATFYTKPLVQNVEKLEGTDLEIISQYIPTGIPTVSLADIAQSQTISVDYAVNPEAISIRTDLFGHNPYQRTRTVG